MASISRMLTIALVDALQPSIVDHRELPWYLRLLLLSEPLHFGNYGGLPLKLIWLAFTLVTLAMSVSGVWVTWATRRERKSRQRMKRSTPLFRARDMRRPKRRRRSRRNEREAKTVVCWVAAVVGLVLALVTDGPGDGVAIALLCWPLIAMAWPFVRSSAASEN